jgi:hypothetical protein
MTDSRSNETKAVPADSNNLDLRVSDGDAETADAQECVEGFTDRPLTINLSARISDGRIGGWLEEDPCFRATWFRQRTDLEDQSQDAYDHALASFGLGAGLTQQEIIDLIVHHRALHKQKQRTRLDYFQRILSKAASATQGASAFGESLGPKSAEPSSSEDDRVSGAGPEPDAEARKTQLCNRVSELLGVKIHRMTKISGQSPIFRMDLAEGQAQFSNVGKLISQRSMRHTLAAITGKLMRQLRPSEWERVAQMLLDACTVEEEGEEMEMEGAARLRLIQYLSATPFIESLDQQSRDSARKPMVTDCVIAICSSDVQTFISKTTSENVSIPEVVAMLSAVGAKAKRCRGDFKEQSRWLLPPTNSPPRITSERTDRMPTLDKTGGTLDGIGFQDHSRSSEYWLVGPPGCGKTTRLAELIRRDTARYGPDSILVTSFSRTAAAEIANLSACCKSGYGRDPARPVLQGARFTEDRRGAREEVECRQSHARADTTEKPNQAARRGGCRR